MASLLLANPLPARHDAIVAVRNLGMTLGMMLWPRTLLWRSVLLIALVLVIAHIAWLQIFRVSEREPRARQMAQQIVSVVNLTRAALVTSQPEKRYDLLDEIAAQEGVQVYAGHPGELVTPLPDRPFLQMVASELRTKLGKDTQLALSRDGVRGVWVSFNIDEDEFWVLLPRSRLERNEPLRWIGLGALVLLLALAGAYLIVARVNRPLKALTQAAGDIGRGATPPPVEESGPIEIRTLSRAFNQMAADRKKLDDERALLLAGVSHDLRTPLARIRLGVEMLGDQKDADLMTGITQDIEDIDAAIGQFLDFARAGNAEESVPDGDLNALVQGVVARYQRTGKQVQLATREVPPLPLRPLAMQRLIGNLIDNALRHGGPQVDIATGIEDGHACIDVMDRGPGLPADQAEQMLQPFTRLDTARSTSGTGLGLAIVDRIAKLHDGRIRLLSRDGGGLRARVELPLCRADTAAVR